MRACGNILWEVNDRHEIIVIDATTGEILEEEIRSISDLAAIIEQIKGMDKEVTYEDDRKTKGNREALK